MRYWFFNGSDVIGPFLPQELAARTDFSADSMLAPETESENQDAWAMAFSFPDFQLNEQTGVLEAVSESSATGPLPAEAPQEPLEIQPPYTAAITPHKEPEKIEPVALVAETEEILPLPEHAEEPTSPQEKPAAEEQAKAASQESTPSKEKLSQEVAPETETLSTCTLPITSQDSYVPPSSLPTVDQVSSAGPESELVSWDEQESSLRRALEDTKQPEELEGPIDSLPPEEISERKILKPHLQSTPEIDAFLHSQEQACKPGRRKAVLMLWILLILLLPGVVGLAVHVTAGGKKQKAKAVAPAPKTEEVKKNVTQMEAGPLVAPAASIVEIPTPPVAVEPAKPTMADQAIAVVKNHKLAGNKGTVSSYFSRLYNKQLAAGYSEEWSAEPLHKSVYIVKYRLTKTRTEPIVYVFQADVSKKKLTGALNNVTLDLVGKI